MTTRRWIISHRRCWITVYVSCRNAQLKYHSNHHVMYLHCHALTICQLPSCNLFTQHVICLCGETPLVNCGPRSSFFYIFTIIYCKRLFCLFSAIIVFFYCKHCSISFSAIYYCFPHHAFNPLFSASR